MRRFGFTLLGVLHLLTCGAATAQEGGTTEQPAVADRAALENDLAATLTDSVLIGSFTVDGQKDEQPLKEERYTLGKVSKLPSGKWLFSARIQYGDHDVTLPLALDVEWAGDTPMVTLTDMAIPGLGTFTSRVFFYRDRYAGTWQHGEHGGHLFGRIEKQDADAPADDAETTAEPGR